MLGFDRFEALTFDCYGTLIDWEAGIWEALQPALTTHHITVAKDEAIEPYSPLYGELEADTERGEYLEVPELQTLAKVMGLI